MSNPHNNLDLSSFVLIAQPDGHKIVQSAIRDFRELHGENWRERLKADFPDLFLIADLCASYDAETAFDKLRENLIERVSGFWQRQLTGLTLDGYKPSLLNLHKIIKAEIKNPPKFRVSNVTSIQRAAKPNDDF